MQPTGCSQIYLYNEEHGLLAVSPVVSFFLSALDLDQPFGFRVALAGGLLKDQVIFVDVAKVVSDLNEPGVFVACEVRAVNAGVPLSPS